jgi:carbon-monoxide dehydrogenase large subunit
MRFSARVADARAALEKSSPTVHRGAPHNLLANSTSLMATCARFARAPHMFPRTLWQHRGGGHSLECRGAWRAYDANEERLTLFSSTQTPHTAMRLLCDMLGWDEHRVRVITPDVGGGFGPKLIFYPEDVAVPLAAILLKRPVKWVEDRREHFVATTQNAISFGISKSPSIATRKFWACAARSFMSTVLIRRAA